MQKENHRCKYCIYSKPIKESDSCFCSQKGIVHANGVCKRFAIDLLRLKSKRLRTLDTSGFFPEDFSIS